MTARYVPALERLAGHGVELVVVGGVAAVLQGAPVVTFDLDLVHRRTEENVKRLLAALGEMEARYRGDPRGLAPSSDLLMGPGHHLLTTVHGPLDLLGAIGDGLTYEHLLQGSLTLELPGFCVPVLELSRLIAVKEFVSRPKDLAVLPTLRATLDEIRRKG